MSRFAVRARAAAVFLAAAASVGCAGMHEYDDVIRGRSSCDSCAGSPWAEIREMTSGRAPCDGPAACACAAPPCVDAATAFPAAARPGEAWCRVVVPATYRTVTEPVTTVCAGTERTWVPPVLETRLRRVCVREAEGGLLRTPGVTRTDVICSEATPARTEMRSVVAQGPCGCTTTCEPVTIPAKNCTTRREVCVAAPGTHAVSTPAEYVNEPCLVEVTPGRWVDRPRPAIVEMRTRVECVTPERVEWRRNPSCTVPAPGAPVAR